MPRQRAAACSKDSVASFRRVSRLPYSQYGIADYDGKALSSRDGDVDAVLVENETESPRAVLTEAGAERENADWSLLPLKTYLYTANSRPPGQGRLKATDLSIVRRDKRKIGQPKRPSLAGAIGKNPADKFVIQENYQAHQTTPNPFYSSLRVPSDSVVFSHEERQQKKAKPACVPRSNGILRQTIHRLEPRRSGFDRFDAIRRRRVRHRAVQLRF